MRLTNMTAREKVLITLAVLSVTIFVAIQPLYSGYIERAERLEVLAKQKKSFLLDDFKKKEILANIKKAKTENKRLEERLATAKNYLIGQKDLNSILGLLENSAITSKVDLVNLSVEVAKKTSQVIYSKNIVRVSLVSEYDALAYFISRLFETSVPLAILRLTVTPKGATGYLLTSIEFEAYTL